MPTTTRHDAGLLLARLGIGGALLAHGTQKLFGWFDGPGLEGTAKAMEAMGFEPGRRSAMAAGLGETGGGALIVSGLASPVAGSVVAGTMAAAASVHKPAGFFAQRGGYEYPAVLGLAAAALSLTGPGAWSLDRVLGHRLNRPWMLVVGFVASALGTTAVLGGRRRSLAAGGSDDAAADATAPEADLVLSDSSPAGDVLPARAGAGAGPLPSR